MPAPNKLPLYCGDVQHLGVEAYHWYMEQGRNKHEFSEQCRRMIRHVIFVTKAKKNKSAAAWNSGSDLPVYLMGGGAQNKLHKEVIDSLSGWLAEWTGNQGFRVLFFEAPRTIEFVKPVKGVINHLGGRLMKWIRNQGPWPLPPEPSRPVKFNEVKDFGRLAVAWGLSYPPTDILESIPPADIEDEVRGASADVSGRYISKDQM